MIVHTWLILSEASVLPEGTEQDTVQMVTARTGIADFIKKHE